MKRSRLLAAAFATVLCSACGPLHPNRPGSSVDPAAGPVGLIMDGSAFQHPGARDAVALALQQITRRRAVVIEAQTSSSDPGVASLAARLAKERPALAAYNWREPQCAGRAVLTGLTHGVDAVYRVALDSSERWRAATAAEAAHLTPPPRTLRNLFGLLDAAPSRNVLEESLTGTVTLWSFGPTSRARPVRIARTATHIGATASTARLDVGEVVGEAIRGLPALRDPQWDTLARHLVSSGCPFLALAVCEMRLKGNAREGGIRTSALAAISGSLGKRAAQKLAKQISVRFNAALQEGNLEEAAAILAEYEASPNKQPATAAELARALESARQQVVPEADGAEVGPPSPQGPYSCSALCQMHMVEICNHDRVLWSSNRKSWEPTPCGTRRTDAFLTQCYQQQWLSGTFRESCILPCEGTAEGHQRLINILRSAGCLRLFPS